MLVCTSWAHHSGRPAGRPLRKTHDDPATSDVDLLLLQLLVYCPGFFPAAGAVLHSSVTGWPAGLGLLLAWIVLAWAPAPTHHTTTTQPNQHPLPPLLVTQPTTTQQPNNPTTQQPNNQPTTTQPTTTQPTQQPSQPNKTQKKYKANNQSTSVE